MPHTFHIPVLGLGYSIDTPLKVARFGISSVISIVDDDLIERMREYHAALNNEIFSPIAKTAPDARARRITAYLDMVERLATDQFNVLQNEPFVAGNDICRYFEMLPEHSLLRQGYDLMMEYPYDEDRAIFENVLRQRMKMGAIDVNIMAKLDKMNFNADGLTAGDEYSDALAGLRGFANSTLRSSVVLSAGMNPRLYSYIEAFTGFYPDENGELKKKIILKVSDFRSAFIQAKFLAKKGLWVSEFRVESGLNCGGHAFATEGYLLGPILEEFKLKRQDMYNELLTSYHLALLTKGYKNEVKPVQRLTAQGGIGTADENKFFLDYYQLDGTGWGSPFLLVPEATNVDDASLQQLTKAGDDDYYLSNASPLGILFNNFKNTTIDVQRLNRLEKGRPGSPCTKKYLCSNTEFTDGPICTASREYQNLKIKQLMASGLPQEDYDHQYETITEKVCLCEGLCSSVYIKLGISKPKENKAVAICPGPNLSYFDRTYSLDEMVKHIYGSIDLLANVKRPHVFIKELNLYVDYLKKDLQNHLKDLNDKKKKGLANFKLQLQNGINYYKQLINDLPDQTPEFLQKWFTDLTSSECELDLIAI